MRKFQEAKQKRRQKKLEKTTQEKGVYQFKDDDPMEVANYSLMQSLDMNQSGFNLNSVLKFTIAPMFTDLKKANYD